MEKMRVPLPNAHWSNFTYESMWVERVSSERYRIRNIPFFVENLAPDDLVEVKDDDGGLVFVSVVEASENSVFVCMCQDQLTATEFLGELKELGLRYEVGFDKEIFAVACDKPRLSNVRKFLRRLEKSGKLEYGELTVR